MPKIDRAHKNYLTPAHLGDIFCGTLIFQQSSMFCTEFRTFLKSP